MREAYLTGGTAPESPPPVRAEEIGLTKVKWNRKDSTLYAEYSAGEAGGYAEFIATHHRPAHADLEAALARVLPHFLLLLELLPGVQQGEEWLKNDNPRFAIMLAEGELVGLPELGIYAVTGYAYSDKGGVVIMGRKTLRSGKVVNLLTPHEPLDPEKLTGLEYEHLWELSTELANCDKEVKLYLAGKSGPYVVEQQTDFLAELQGVVQAAPGEVSLTISAGGKSATITKRGKKGAANDE